MVVLATSGTHRPFPVRDAWTKQRPLPSPRVLLSRRLKRYYGRLRLPPGTPSTSRLSTGYRTRRFRQHRRPPGRGGPPQVPPPPSERSAPSTPGSSSGLHSRLFTPSVAFAVKDATRLPLPPTPRGRAAITTRQASLEATDRSVAPPTGALDAGLRPGPFPSRAASLLPGLLTATRTFPGRRRRAYVGSATQ